MKNGISEPQILCSELLALWLGASRSGLHKCHVWCDTYPNLYLIINVYLSTRPLHWLKIVLSLFNTNLTQDVKKLVCFRVVYTELKKKKNPANTGTIVWACYSPWFIWQVSFMVWLVVNVLCWHYCKDQMVIVFAVHWCFINI